MSSTGSGDDPRDDVGDRVAQVLVDRPAIDGGELLVDAPEPHVAADEAHPYRGQPKELIQLLDGARRFIERKRAGRMAPPSA